MKTKSGFTIETQADGTLPRVTWPGVYPLIYILRDAGTICAECANGEHGSLASLDNEDPQWDIVGQQVLWENECAQLCDHCNQLLECAYPVDPTPTHVTVKLTDSGSGRDYSVDDNGMVTAVEIRHPMGGRNATLTIESHGALSGSMTLPLKDAEHMVARLLQVAVEDLPTVAGTETECRVLR